MTISGVEEKMESSDSETRFRLFFNKHYRLITMIAIFVMLPGIYLLVYFTGGIKYVYSHSMYIPILLAGIIFGPVWGVVIATVAAILLGPLMPIDTETHVPQEFFNWFYRMLIFVLLGFISGYTSKKLRRNAERIDQLMSHNLATHVPNVNYLRRYPQYLDDVKQAIITILINNYNSIVDVMGTEMYQKLVSTIYADLERQIKGKKLIVQPETNKLWIVKHLTRIKDDASEVVMCLNKTWVIDGIPLYVDFAIGATEAASPDECRSLDCFKGSDTSARYAQLNNLPYIIYDRNLMRRRQEFELLSVFQNAMETNETFLVYQPKMDLKTLKPVGLEALIRWKHPEKGMIMPDVFIPLVEETKLIHPLTDWVMRRALEKILEFSAIGIDVPISVNVSAKNLFDPEFYVRTMRLIEASQIKRHLLEIELTESVLMTNPTESRKILDHFVNSGIKIAIDDFGKGYSSLAYLSQFPIDTIKIDKFFMKQIDTNLTSQHIVKATIQLSKQLGYKVLAEGVEDKEIVEAITNYECDYAQGYYFAKPMANAQIIEWYRDNL